MGRVFRLGVTNEIVPILSEVELLPEGEPGSLTVSGFFGDWRDYQPEPAEPEVSGE
jgi:hypothetical protein